MPVLIGGSLVMQWLLKDQADTRERRFAVVDRSPGGRLYESLDAACRRRNEVEIFDPQTHKQTKPVFNLERVGPSAADPDAVARQRLELSDRVRRRDLFGFL